MNENKWEVWEYSSPFDDGKWELYSTHKHWICAKAVQLSDWWNRQIREKEDK